jgi:hypothetical protein
MQKRMYPEGIYDGSGRWKDPWIRDVEVEEALRKDKRPKGRRFED